MLEPTPERPRAARASALGLAAILILAPWLHGGYPDYARYAVTTLLLATAALWLWTRPDLEKRLVVPVLVFGAWAFAQVVFGIGSSPVSSIESGLVLAADLAVFVLVATEARDRRAAVRWAFILIGTCAAQAIYGIVQSHEIPMRAYGLASELVTAPYGSYYNHNHFAGLCEMGALLAAGVALGWARRVEAIDPVALGLGGAALGLAGAVLASRSRGGGVALAGGTLVLVPLWLNAQRSRRARRTAIWAALAVGLLALAFGWLAVPAETRAHLATLLGGPTDLSGQYRVAIYQATYSLALQHPLFGSGLGTFADAVGPLRRGYGNIHALHADSDVLEFAAEAGLVGLLLLGAVIWGGLRGFRHLMAAGHDPLRKGVAVGALAAVAALTLHSFVDFNLRLPANAAVFAALAGLASASRSGHRFRLFPKPRLLVVAGVALAGLSAWRFAGALDYGAASRIANPHERLSALTASVKRHPYMPSLWLVRAMTWLELANGDPVVAGFRLDRARADAERCLSLRAAWPEAWMDLGWIRLGRHDEAGARAAMEQARTLDPVRIPLALTRAEFFMRIGDADGARQELIQLHRYNPKDWTLANAEEAARRLGLGTAQVGALSRTDQMLR